MPCRAHYNAFCGNLAAPTHCLRSLGPVSSSAVNSSLHTRCGRGRQPGLMNRPEVRPEACVGRLDGEGAAKQLDRRPDEETRGETWRRGR